jgi:predicted phosphate transport protein (TIGR00153 family)
MARFSLIPREEKFYDDFKAFADQLKRGARLLEQMLATDPPAWDKSHEIKEVEHQCDHLTHEVIQRLNKTFITPIDREDIHALARTLDDVMDEMDNAAHLIPLYKIEKIRRGARELVRVILEQCDEIRKAVEALEARKGVLERAIEINRLENEADRIHKTAIGALFDEERDPIVILKWKEIFDVLERATDRCEDVANLLENVVVKQS